ncbi:MAG TPA: RsbRD N-terminal domain-containing protein, partial [Flavisolibacter sp.]|nr:RsbRD N-terminal domain-containing protein [Flavisolibacter sp.]
MSIDVAKLLQKKKKQIMEDWMTNQLSDAGLRDDLMSNEDLREQSDELLDTFLKVLTEKNLGDAESSDFEPVLEILAGISMSRARQGFSPRETGVYVFSLKEALIRALQTELKEDTASLLDAVVRMNRLMDAMSLATFETFIKGREEIILRQTDEIAEISTPVIRVWDGILALPIIGT